MTSVWFNHQDSVFCLVETGTELGNLCFAYFFRNSLSSISALVQMVVQRKHQVAVSYTLC